MALVYLLHTFSATFPRTSTRCVQQSCMFTQMQRRDKRPLSAVPSFFLCCSWKFSYGKMLISQRLNTCLQCSEQQQHPSSVSPVCLSSNNTPGTRSLAVTAPNPSFHSTDFWIKEGRFPHLWIVLCYGAHTSFHASFLLWYVSKWENFLIYTDLDWFWMGHWML